MKGNTAMARGRFDHHGLIVFLLILGFPVLCHASSAVMQNPDNGHYYQRIDTVNKWPSARNYCENVGGYLATIASAEENRFVLASFGNVGTLWLGASNEGQAGNWQWTTGEPWEYTNWESGEPSPGQNYLTLWAGRQGKWDNDGPPAYHDRTYAFVCEWSVNPQSLSEYNHQAKIEADYFSAFNQRAKRAPSGGSPSITWEALTDPIPSMTDIQWQEFERGNTGKTLKSAGYVFEVQHCSDDTCDLVIYRNAKTKPTSIWGAVGGENVVFKIPKSMGVPLKKDQKVRFSGTIQKLHRVMDIERGGAALEVTLNPGNLEE